MEEVDKIILQFLKRLNTKIDDNVNSIASLPVETIILAVSKCLNTINPSLKAPLALPPGISHKIEVAAHVATLCKDIGYKGEVGYQTFLYCNENDLRQVFMFLIERLPTESDIAAAPVTASDKKSILYQKIKAKINEDFNAVWKPPCCVERVKRQAGDFVSNDYQSEFSKSTKSMDELVELLKKSRSLTTEPSLEVIKGEHKNNVAEESKNDHEDLESEVNSQLDQKDMTLKEVKEEVMILRQRLDMLNSEKNIMEAEYSQTQKKLDRVNGELIQMESIQQLIVDLGVSSDAGIQQIVATLQSAIENLHARIDNYTHKNLSLKSQIENAKLELSMAEGEKGKMVRTLQGLKETAMSLKEEYKTKEAERLKLRSEYEKINKGGNKRSTYTKRIMEIIANVAKQKVEIDKILNDTRIIQKEINNLTGQLDRSFSLADETLFRDAKKDEQAKKAYKLLALLHSDCSTIVSLVNDTGTLSREIIDLEDHIEDEKSKRIEETLTKIQADLVQIRKETQFLGKNENA